MNKFYKLETVEDCPKCLSNIKWYQSLGYGHHKYHCKKCGYIWEWKLDVNFTQEELDDHNDYANTYLKGNN